MLIPHGGKLVNKIATEDEKKEILQKAKHLKNIVIPDRYISDCEMIANGGFSPLNGFMTKDDAEEVIINLHLTSGILWSIPILLPIPENIHKDIKVGDELILRDKYNTAIALMVIEDKFSLDLDIYCKNIFKTTDDNHPGVRVVKQNGNKFIGGEIVRLLNRPKREKIKPTYYLDPLETRKLIEQRKWKSVVAFQTRNPIHRAHEYLIKAAMEPMDGALIHPLVGETKSDDIPADIRMQCYEVLIENYFPKDKVILSVLPASMHYAGPREAVHHMILRKNYGATHMIIGRDHAGVGNYYGTYEAQEFVEQFKKELEIQPLKFEHTFYCVKCESMASSKTCPHSPEYHLHLSGTKVRAMLREGKKPPKEFTRPEIANILIKWSQSQYVQD